MLSKQRIHHTTNFHEPDKVPAHMNAARWVVAKLKKALQVDSEKELLKALNIDVYDMRGIDLHSGTVPRYAGPPNDLFNPGWKGGIGSLWGITEIENRTGAGWTLDMGEPPLAGEISMEDLEKYHYSNQACDRFLANLGGWADIGDKLRWPYRSVPIEFGDKIKNEAVNLIPEFFSNKS